jgi:hypothetical protein
MNYELALELRTAGFPQGFHPHEERHHSWIDANGHYLSSEGDQTSCYVPTLSELIEACGDLPFTLNHPAVGTNWVSRCGNYPHFFTGIGSKPEDAVARVWLALNHTRTPVVGGVRSTTD